MQPKNLDVSKRKLTTALQKIRRLKSREVVCSQFVQRNEKFARDCKGFRLLNLDDIINLIFTSLNDIFKKYLDTYYWQHFIFNFQFTY